MIRETKILRRYLEHNAGSVLIETGKTRVLCTVSVEEGVPQFLRESEQGWLTAEYGMLPGCSPQRVRREASRGKISGRTAEIQRLIGRSLRAAVNLEMLAGYTIIIDCDVIQADGGTRTASITGACIALYDKFNEMIAEGLLPESPLPELTAAVSVGIVNGEVVLDLDYEADSAAEVDLNVVMTDSGKFIEVQGTAEGCLYSRTQLDAMLDLAQKGIEELIKRQKEELGV